MPYGIYKHKRKPLIERFWAKVQKTDNCWLWTASCNQDGYGHLWIGENNGKLIRAHHPGRKGADNSQAKLTTEDVIRIRNLYPQKSGQGIADEYGLHRGHVYAIVHKRRWKYL